MGAILSKLWPKQSSSSGQQANEEPLALPAPPVRLPLPAPSSSPSSPSSSSSPTSSSPLNYASKEVKESFSSKKASKSQSKPNKVEKSDPIFAKRENLPEQQSHQESQPSQQQQSQPQPVIYKTVLEATVADARAIEEEAKKNAEEAPGPFEIETDMLSPDIEEAVIKIQASVRGFLARKQYRVTPEKTSQTVNQESNTVESSRHDPSGIVAPPPSFSDTPKDAPLEDINQGDRIAERLIELEKQFTQAIGPLTSFKSEAISEEAQTSPVVATESSMLVSPEKHEMHKTLEVPSIETPVEPLEEAATKIQAAYRGYQVRKTISREASPSRGKAEFDLASQSASNLLGSNQETEITFRDRDTPLYQDSERESILVLNQLEEALSQELAKSSEIISSCDFNSTSKQSSQLIENQENNDEKPNSSEETVILVQNNGVVDAAKIPDKVEIQNESVELVALDIKVDAADIPKADPSECVAEDEKADDSKSIEPVILVPINAMDASLISETDKPSEPVILIPKNEKMDASEPQKIAHEFNAEQAKEISSEAVILIPKDIPADAEQVPESEEDNQQEPVILIAKDEVVNALIAIKSDNEAEISNEKIEETVSSILKEIPIDATQISNETESIIHLANNEKLEASAQAPTESKVIENKSPEAINETEPEISADKKVDNLEPVLLIPIDISADAGQVPKNETGLVVDKNATINIDSNISRSEMEKNENIESKKVDPVVLISLDVKPETKKDLTSQNLETMKGLEADKQQTVIVNKNMSEPESILKVQFETDSNQSTNSNKPETEVLKTGSDQLTGKLVKEDSFESDIMILDDENVDKSDTLYDIIADKGLKVNEQSTANLFPDDDGSGLMLYEINVKAKDDDQLQLMVDTSESITEIKDDILVNLDESDSDDLEIASNKVPESLTSDKESVVENVAKVASSIVEAVKESIESYQEMSKVTFKDSEESSNQLPINVPNKQSKDDQLVEQKEQLDLIALNREPESLSSLVSEMNAANESVISQSSLTSTRSTENQLDGKLNLEETNSNLSLNSSMTVSSSQDNFNSKQISDNQSPSIESVENQTPKDSVESCSINQGNQGSITKPENERSLTLKIPSSTEETINSQSSSAQSSLKPNIIIVSNQEPETSRNDQNNSTENSQTTASTESPSDAVSPSLDEFDSQMGSEISSPEEESNRMLRLHDRETRSKSPNPFGKKKRRGKRGKSGQP